jgi:hypothetical protein
VLLSILYLAVVIERRHRRDEEEGRKGGQRECSIKRKPIHIHMYIVPNIKLEMQKQEVHNKANPPSRGMLQQKQKEKQKRSEPVSLVALGMHARLIYHLSRCYICMYALHRP